MIYYSVLEYITRSKLHFSLSELPYMCQIDIHPKIGVVEVIYNSYNSVLNTYRLLYRYYSYIKLNNKTKFHKITSNKTKKLAQNDKPSRKTNNRFIYIYMYIN